MGKCVLFDFTKMLQFFLIILYAFSIVDMSIVASATFIYDEKLIIIV